MDSVTVENNIQENVNKVVRGISGRVNLPRQQISTAVASPINLPLQRDRSKLAFTIENVLSPVECQTLITEAEKISFGKAGLGSSGGQVAETSVRDSGRLICEDHVLAAQIFDRVRQHLPVVWQGRRILGLNEQLKFLKYQKGQKFVAHFDGSFKRHGTSNQTFLTLQVYLATVPANNGGSTRFIGRTPDEGVRCCSVQGRAVVFQHNILHEGELVSGNNITKYTIRTDVEYGPPSITADLQETVGFGGSPAQIRQRLKLLGLFLTLSLGATFIYRTNRDRDT